MQIDGGSRVDQVMEAALHVAHNRLIHGTHRAFMDQNIHRALRLCDSLPPSVSSKGAPF